MDYPKVVLGKDTVADKEYLEVREERIAQVKFNQLSEKDKLLAKIAEMQARIAEIDAAE